MFSKSWQVRASGGLVKKQVVLQLCLTGKHGVRVLKDTGDAPGMDAEVIAQHRLGTCVYTDADSGSGLTLNFHSREDTRAGFLFSSAASRDMFVATLKALQLFGSRLVRFCDAGASIAPASLPQPLPQLYVQGGGVLPDAEDSRAAAEQQEQEESSEPRTDVFTVLTHLWQSISCSPLPPSLQLARALGWPVIGLLPGERVIGSQILASRFHPVTMSLSRGIFLVTNHRLIYRTYRSMHAGFEALDVMCPLMQIARVSRDKKRRINVHMLDHRIVVFGFDASKQSADQLVKQITLLLANSRNSIENRLAFSSRATAKSQHGSAQQEEDSADRDKDNESGDVEGWDLFQPEREYARLKLTESDWRLVDNSTFCLVEAYPSHFVVPAAVSDEKLAASLAFRTNRRPPAVVWRHPGTSACLARSSAPAPTSRWGGAGKTKSDEELISILRVLNPNRDLFLIAPLDKTKFERFGKCQPFLLDTDRSADVKAAHTRLTALCAYYSHSFDLGPVDGVGDLLAGAVPKTKMEKQRDQLAWWPRLHSTGWLAQQHGLLCDAVESARILHEAGISILLYDTNGCDRSAQLSSLTQLLLDPYYRTLEGLAVLIEKEWLGFGHPFAQRAGSTSAGLSGTSSKASASGLWSAASSGVGSASSASLASSSADEYAPVPCSADNAPLFLLWVEVIWQLMMQFPFRFEYNEAFLVAILEEVSSARFGTFLGTTERDRRVKQVRTRCISLWTHLLSPGRRHRYANPMYVAKESGQGKEGSFVLWPNLAPRALQFWEGWHMRWERSRGVRQPMSALQKAQHAMSVRLGLVGAVQDDLIFDHARAAVEEDDNEALDVEAEVEAERKKRRDEKRKRRKKERAAKAKKAGGGDSARVKQLTADVAKSEKRAAELSAELAGMTAQHAAIEQKEREARGELQKALGRIEEVEGAYSATLQRLSQERAASVGSRANAEDYGKDEIKSMLATQGAKVQEARAEIAILAGQKKQLDIALDAAEAKAAALSKRTAELEASQAKLREQHAELTRAYEDRGRAVATLERETAALREEKEDQKAQHKRREQELADKLQQSKKRQQELDDTLRDTSERLATATERLTHLETQRQEAEARKEQQKKDEEILPDQDRLFVSIPSYNADDKKVVFNLRVREFYTRFDYLEWPVDKRYSEFAKLRERLKDANPGYKYKKDQSFPHLPAKAWTNNQDEDFLNARRLGLQHFMEQLLEIDDKLDWGERDQFLMVGSGERQVQQGSIKDDGITAKLSVEGARASQTLLGTGKVFR